MVLTSVNQYPVNGMAGLPVGTFFQARSYINNALNVPGVNDVVITAANSTVYTMLIGGVTISITSGGSATAATIRDQLIAAIQANAYTNALVTAAASGNNVRITERTPVNGVTAVTESDANLALTVVTAHGGQQPIPAGVVVAKGTGGDQDCRLPSGSTDDLLGVVVHQHQAIRGDDYPTGSSLYEPNSVLSVMNLGEIWVPVEEAITPASAVFVRYAASGANVQLGGFRASADSSSAVAWTRAKYRSTQATVGGLARLSISLP